MIIYTSITNGYCELPEIEDLGHQYICFHDGTVEQKSPWELREIKYEHENPVIRSRHPKILFHEYFDEPCVYVDASRLHLINTQEFFDTSENILRKRNTFVLDHPEQHNYFEECLEYYIRSWVEEDNIVNFTQNLKDFGYDFLNHETIFACVMWRKPTKDVIAWSNLWWDLYLQSGPRDQLSGSSSLKLSGIKYTIEHPVKVISQFAFYRDWWNDLSGKSGDYKIKNEDKKNWKSFINNLSNASGVDCKTKIDLNHLQYLKNSKFGDVFNTIVNSYDCKLTTDVIQTKAQIKSYDIHAKALKQSKDVKITVYSCITNNYDNIPSENYYDPDVRYVMFHDGTIDTTVGPWEYIDIRDYCDLDCPRRLSSFPKLNPHKLFNVGEHTVWIDACYIQTKEFIEFSKTVFPTMGVTTLEHCYRFTYYDEMLEGFLCGFFSYDAGIELTKKLAEIDYNFKNYISPCCTILWRTIKRSKTFTDFCDLWWKWSLVGSNRDQHSFDAARQIAGIHVDRVENKPPSTISAGIDLKFDLKNKNRKGKHPKRGNNNQWKRREEFLKELQEYTGLNPKIYAKHEHITMMDWNGVFETLSDRQEYMMKSPTMRNLAHQQSLWGDFLSINDAVWSDHKPSHLKRIDAARLEKIKNMKVG
jgi:hypothetical protein